MNKFLAVTALTLGLLMQAERSSGSAFRVTPVRVDLSQRSASALLTLLNESDQELRFQISAFAWSQEPSGAMKLDATTDITFFPALLTLKPGEERKVRVGTKVFAQDVEKSYRIFFEELPSLKTQSVPPQGAQVRILTKMGVPIFVTPEKSKYAAAIDGAAVADGKLTFNVKNNGTAHYSVTSVNVTGFDAGGAKAFEKQMEGWYVLPGTPRTYEMEIPSGSCSQVKKLTISVSTDIPDAAIASATAAVDVTGSACKTSK